MSSKIVSILLGYTVFIIIANLLYSTYREKFRRAGVEVSGITIVWRIFRKEIVPSETSFKRIRKHGYVLDALILIMIGSLFIGLKILFENIFGIVRAVGAAQAPTKGVVTPVVPLIPGVTISLANLPMILAVIALAALVHEGMHAIVSLIEGSRVKSAGLALITIILAPFVELEEKDFEKLKLRSKLRILSAGVSGNVGLAIVSIVLFALLLPMFFNLYPGLYIAGVVENSAAKEANIPENMVIVAINGTFFSDKVNVLTLLFSPQKLNDILSEFKLKGRTLILKLMNPKDPSKVVDVVVVRNSTKDPIGVYLYPYIVMKPKGALEAKIGYFAQTFLIWSFAINLGLAAINAIPIFITDGGKALDEVLKLKLRRNGTLISKAIQGFLLAILLVNMVFSVMLYVP